MVMAFVEGFEWRSDNRIVMMQVRDSEGDQNILRAHCSLQGVLDNAIVVLRIVICLQDKDVLQHSEGLSYYRSRVSSSVRTMRQQT